MMVVLTLKMEHREGSKEMEEGQRQESVSFWNNVSDRTIINTFATVLCPSVKKAYKEKRAKITCTQKYRYF
jgi:hypothetical protein